MKTRLILSLSFFIISIGFIFMRPSTENSSNIVIQPPPSPGGGLDKFYVGAIMDEEDYHHLPEGTYEQLDQLGFNLWHEYNSSTSNSITHREYPASPFGVGVLKDTLMGEVSDYAEDIVRNINNLIYSHNQRRPLMPRPKIDWLIYGQRSDYQCEEVSTGDMLWFYSFLEHSAGADITDSGQVVRYCQRNPNQTDGGANWVARKLKANTEQCMPFGKWNGDYECDWLIKLRIRLDQDFVNNSNNWNTPVCSLTIKNQEDNIIKNVVLKARNFLDNNNYYDGSYKEEFRIFSGDDTLIIHGAWGDKFMWEARGNHNPDRQDDNHADIQVYWYGNCDAWFDYVRVDNDVADKLFKGYYEEPGRKWIEDEVEQIAIQPAEDGKYPMLKYYMELFQFNNIPCMAYVNQKLQYWSNYYSNGAVTIDLISTLTPDNLTFHVPWDDRTSVWNVSFIYENYIQKVNPTCIYSESYPLIACSDKTQDQQPYSQIPNTLPKFIDNENKILAKPVSPAVFDQWLQDNLDHKPSTWEGGITHNCNGTTERPYDDMSQYPGQFRGILQMCDTLSKLSEKPFMFMPQAHQWYSGWETHPEPTNEELDMMANVIVSYGARGLNYFYYPSQSYTESDDRPLRNYPYSAGDYGTGIADADRNLRTVNYYEQGLNNSEQYKWKVIQRITDRMVNKWGPYLMGFDNDNRHSYILYDETERNLCRNNTYINNVVSYKPGNQNPNCWTDIPDRNILPSDGLIYECPEDNYVQAATFNTIAGNYVQYFMVVNRRCSPYKDSTSEDNRGGRRFMRVWFHANTAYFPAYKSWKIINVEDPARGIPFDKTSSSAVNLGWFMPGEGKLYKVVPVMQKGGTLVADEDVSDEVFTCEDTVWNDGYDISITGSSDVSFSDSATIVMNGGTFQSGDASGGPVSNKITYTSAVSGHKWGGLRFYGSSVKIYNSEFLNINSPDGGSYAISSVDCPLNDIRYNIFTSSTDTAGGINICYVNYSLMGTPPNSYIMYNTITMNNSYSRALQVQGFAGLTEGVYIEHNTMTSNGYASGIFLSTITGGVIKDNTLIGFETGINTMSSTCDLYGNTISNSTGESKGILAVESSSLNMSPSGSMWTGGMNNITNIKDNSVNLEIDESNFFINDGANSFDILSSATQPYHLYGSFWNTSYSSDATDNCFKLSGTEITDPDLPYNNVTDGTNQVAFQFLSYNCSQSVPECSDIVNIGNGLYDTIPYSCGGGGGLPAPRLRKTSCGQARLRESGGQSSKTLVTQTPKQLYDSVKIQLRHRNYASVKNLCYQLIDNYPDSTESIASLQTLYMAQVISDTTTSSRAALKVYYEGLILNHGNNSALVKISNYLVQKCKVLLRQYSSALSGFQLIINNNQYNYEGLLARWDYMATSLLMQGQGGSERRETPNVKRETDISPYQGETEWGSDEPEEYGQIDDDKNPFSKEERVTIKKNVSEAMERTKNYGEKRIEILQRESERNNERAKKELQRINRMKQVIKVERPKNIIEHIKIVNTDIQNIFGSTLMNNNTTVNNVPSVYRLAQNYPNPFNPVTTIKYELPKDSKVKLVIYDLLGREVKILVNNEVKSAGYYKIDFNMQNYASGVYFYRIEADDLRGEKFVNAKKMVLVK